jgi:hypothetical protein
MGALLLPKRLVERALGHLLRIRGGFGGPVLPVDRREDATRLLGDTFDVNPAVARIRLATLYPQSELDQLTL